MREKNDFIEGFFEEQTPNTLEWSALPEGTFRAELEEVFKSLGNIRSHLENMYRNPLLNIPSFNMLRIRSLVYLRALKDYREQVRFN